MSEKRTREKNIQLLKKAVELEQSDVPAHTWLADQYRNIFQFLNNRLDGME